MKEIALNKLSPPKDKEPHFLPFRRSVSPSMKKEKLPSPRGNEPKTTKSMGRQFDFTAAVKFPPIK